MVESNTPRTDTLIKSLIDCDVCTSSLTPLCSSCEESFQLIRSLCRELEVRVRELEEAIRYHAEQKEDDRCFLDDLKLYKLIGIEEHPGLKLPKEAFLSNCSRYWECQQANKDYKTFTVDELKEYIMYVNEYLNQSTEIYPGGVLTRRLLVELHDRLWGIFIGDE